MQSDNEDLTRKRFDTFARTVRQQASRINGAVQRGDTATASRLSIYLIEEACLHLRRLNGIPDNLDDSGEGPDGATDDFAIDLARLNGDFGEERPPS